MKIIYGQDGFVKSVITAIPDDVDPSVFLQEGDRMIDGTADPGCDKVVGGVVVRAPDRPSDFHVFDRATFSWVQNLGIAWSAVRAKRAKLLVESDWTQLPDVPIDTKEAWATYRQALRDVTNQPDPLNIVWPVAP